MNTPREFWRCPCGDEVKVSAIIPSGAWEQIAKGDYILCVGCIDSRLQEAGLHVEGAGVFHGKGLSFGPWHGFWRLPPQITDATQGNPHFYSSAPFWRDR